jgi:hypothetical protein
VPASRRPCEGHGDPDGNGNTDAAPPHLLHVGLVRAGSGGPRPRLDRSGSGDQRPRSLPLVLQAVSDGSASGATPSRPPGHLGSGRRRACGGSRTSRQPSSTSRTCPGCSTCPRGSCARPKHARGGGSSAQRARRADVQIGPTPRGDEPSVIVTGVPWRIGGVLAGCPVPARAGRGRTDRRRGRLVGVDCGNVDDTGDLSRPAHTVLLAAGIPIVENLEPPRPGTAPPRWVRLLGAADRHRSRRGVPGASVRRRAVTEGATARLTRLRG